MEYSTSKYWEFLALVAGLLAALSFSPFKYSYLIIVSLTLLFASWSGVPAWRAAVRGYLFGLGFFGLGVYWVYISIHDYGGASVVVSCLLTLLFVAFWSIFPAVSGYFSVKIFSASPVALQMPLFAVIWILIEYLRGAWVLNGFPWLQIAYSQLDTPLAGYLPIFGAYGVGLLLALTASSLVIILNRHGKSIIWCAVIISFWGGGSLLKSINWTHVIGEPIKVTLIQGNISQDKKWLPENRDKTLKLYREMTNQHWDSDVVIWPETAVPAFYHVVRDNFLLPLEQQARKNQTDLVISIPVREAEDTYYNAVMTFGKKQGIYRKIHLLPFGEYLPLQPLSGFLLDKLKILPVGTFTAGATDQALIEAGGYPFTVTICYEDAFGEEGIRNIENSAYLVNVTNDAWFGDSIEPHQHMQIARMRAIETGRYLLRATNTGLTGIVDPDGRIIKQAPLFETTTLTDEIYPMGGMTPYSKTGDKPFIFSLLYLLVLVIVKR